MFPYLSHECTAILFLRKIVRPSILHFACVNEPIQDDAHSLPLTVQPNLCPPQPGFFNLGLVVVATRCYGDVNCSLIGPTWREQ